MEPARSFLLTCRDLFARVSAAVAVQTIGAALLHPSRGNIDDDFTNAVLFRTSMSSAL